MRRLLIVAVLLACSCAHQPAPAQEQVRALVLDCGLEGKVEFKWVGSDKLTMTRLDTDAEFAKFMCVSHGLEDRGMKLGFEGRERLKQ